MLAQIIVDDGCLTVQPCRWDYTPEEARCTGEICNEVYRHGNPTLTTQFTLIVDERFVYAKVYTIQIFDY
jgi:hypothetical protein